MPARFERLEEGVLCTFSNGLMLLFNSAPAAANFANALHSVATTGQCGFDNELERLTREV